MRNRVNVTRKSVNVAVGKRISESDFRFVQLFFKPMASPADFPENPCIFAVVDSLDLLAKPCAQLMTPFGVSPDERPRSVPAAKREETTFIMRFITAADCKGAIGRIRTPMPSALRSCRYHTVCKLVASYAGTSCFRDYQSIKKTNGCRSIKFSQE